jgi:hypothetical protein
LTVLVERTVKVFVPSVLVWIGAPDGTEVPFPIAPVHVTTPVPMQPYSANTPWFCVYRAPAAGVVIVMVGAGGACVLAAAAGALASRLKLSGNAKRSRRLGGFIRFLVLELACAEARDLVPVGLAARDAIDAGV